MSVSYLMLNVKLIQLKCIIFRYSYFWSVAAMKNWVAFLNGQCNKVYYLFKHLLSLLFVILLGKEFNHSSVLSTVSSKSKMVVVKIVERNSKFFRLLFRSHFSSYKHTYSVPYLKFIKKNHFNFFIAVYRFNVYSFRF